MREDFQTIKEQLPGICKIASDFYLTPKRKGSVFFVKSPATADKHESLALYPGSNRFVDFANGGFKGDSIAFLAYIRDCNQWQALKELQAYYGLADAREQDRQEARRRILAQQEQEQKKRQRQQAFKTALFGEIDRLKRWGDIYKDVLRNRLYEPLTNEWAHCVNELHKTSYQLDILCASDCSSYRLMKTSSGGVPSDYPQWLLDSLAILAECGAFQAKQSELAEIKKQRDFELTRKPGGKRRCGIEW